MPVPVRIGVLFCGLQDLNIKALKYLTVHLNTLQSSFEFEILQVSRLDSLCKLLSQETEVDREECRKMLDSFRKRILNYFSVQQETYGLADKSLPSMFIIVSMARFSDGFYGLKANDVQVQALGAWADVMAPPSIFEFILTQMLRQAVGFAAPAMSMSIHLGTKGCLFDFTADLSEARYKALQGFICSVCRERLKSNGLETLADELVPILQMNWLGRLDHPHCPATIVEKLGYNLFLTKGIEPTWKDKLFSALREEGVKEMVKLVGELALAASLFWLGYTHH